MNRKEMYLLENVYVVMNMLRNNSQIDDEYGNLGMYCKVVYCVNDKYYLIDSSNEVIELVHYDINKAFDKQGEKVAVVCLNKNKENIYNEELPYIANKKIDYKIITRDGKRYICGDDLFNFQNEYNVILSKAMDEDLRYFKNKLKENKKVNRGKR